MEIRQKLATGVIALILIAMLFGGVLVNLYTDYLWFVHDVKYPQIFGRILALRWVLFLLTAVGFFLFALVNLMIANRIAGATEASDLAIRGGRIVRITRAVRRGTYYLLILGALVFSVFVGLSASAYWHELMLFQNAQSFGVKDPLFNMDIGFYVFRLPFMSFVSGLLVFTALVALVGIGAFYYFNRALGWLGGMPTFLPSVKPHMLILATLFLIAFAWYLWLARYDLVFSEHDQFFGAGYTDIHARLPILNITVFGLLIAAVLCLVSLRRGAGLLLPIGGFAVALLFWIAASLIYPPLVQRFVVIPNQLERESEYIERHLAFTRRAYNLDTIQVRVMDVRDDLTAADLQGAQGTLANLRLWDFRPLRQVYNGLQALKPYYAFVDIDVDRYTVNGALRQVLLSVRELNLEGLPATAQRWQNLHLLYTHGFGLVMNPVNEATAEGQPVFWIRNLPPQVEPSVQEAIPVTNPAIYFGENLESYAIVRSNLKELDYPKLTGTGDAEENVYTTYNGDGGVPIGGLLTRLMFAIRLSDQNIMLTGDLNAESRLLFRRNIRERLQAMLPFIRWDEDAYPVIHNGEIVWIYDGYTVSRNYPYSRPFFSRDRIVRQFNYLRNSVKATVHAYTGEVNFYISDESDPLIRAYAQAYPNVFKPLSEMPAGLRNHIRYPIDLFEVQAQLLELYHTTDARIFFNKEDVWAIAREILQNNETVPMTPYYVIMQPPGEQQPRYMLTLPFTPQQRKNLVAWLAAHCDPDRYGELVLYRFPKQKTVYGPEQIEARINQNPEITQQLNLWNQQGSQVFRGNLLIIPLGQAMLYFKPIYLQARTEGAIPELKKVVLASGERVVMTDTVDEGLQLLLARRVGRTPPRLTQDGTTPPTPTAPPTPVGTSADLRNLAREANRVYREAQSALRNGDWATYGERMKQLEQLLKQMEGAP
ncbi:MAG: UPF0182 family protein [Armatimonadetes bacterium]|jgi:uncharacterized membrane protein (UPF0182 family)|nr:MAG: UPF0182 family protein [Armatimonadota bacterium]